MNNAVKEWIEYAQMDLTTCEQLDAVVVGKQYRIICYHAQQAAEKMLKALLVLFGEVKLVRTHDLTTLLDLVSRYCGIKDGMVKYAQVLTPYAVNQRYPGGDDVDEVQAKIAIKYCREIFAWAMETIERYDG